MCCIYRKYLKRPLDIIVSMAALIVLSPVFLFVTLLVCMNLGRPVIFKQQRPGLNEKAFNIYKFRTMTGNGDAKSRTVPDEKRLTGLGRMLRATSLDELPQLFNILKGDMSFVGPRPLLEQYLPYYTEEEKLRHSVRPGLTGLAQVSGRNFVSWDKRLKLDVEYVKNVSFFLDAKIMLLTVNRVIQRKDVAVRNPQFMNSLDRERGM